jgi:VanZ family protein
MRLLLVAGGWLYAAAIVYLSLTPSPPEPGFEYGDKLGHFLAYALLMLWFALLYRSAGARLAYGALWIALGIALEYAQAGTDYRSFELADMAADVLGVAAGAAAALILPRARAAEGTGTR